MSETPNPNFLQELEKKADAFFESVKEEVNHVIHPEAPADAAPSSTEPAPEVEPSGESSAIVTASNTEAIQTPADTSATDTTHATADASASPSTQSTSTAGIEDPNAAVPHAAAPSISDTLSSAPSAPSSAGESLSAASSAGGEPAAEATAPQTFEQMVEARFLKLEAAFMQLPHSIHTILSGGSVASAEDFAKAVLAHVFAHI